MDEIGLEMWTRWARGPIFRACLIFMVLGLVRHLLLTLGEIIRSARPAGCRAIPCGQVTLALLRWARPGKRLRDRFPLGPIRLIHLACIALVPLLLAGHIVLWRKAAGISWPSLPNSLADVLTLLAVALSVLLVAERALPWPGSPRGRTGESLLPLAFALPFASGFLVRHPGLNPFTYEVTLLFHVMSANLFLVLLPLTRRRRSFFLPRLHATRVIHQSISSEAGGRAEPVTAKGGESI